jgi:hypothetical protein
MSNATIIPFGIQLTKMEADILQHRMEVRDAITDYICGETECTEESVCAGFDDIDNGRLTDMAKLILKDCVEGSTFYGATLYNGLSRQHENAVLSAGRRLAVKVGNLIGEELTYPSH